VPPLVTCIMPTANRRAFVPAAIAQFLAQDYPNKELLVLDNGRESVADLVPDHPAIRYIEEHSLRTLGALRNRACELARGDIIAHWDDDDWYPPDRLSRQVEALDHHRADVCGSSRVYFLDAARRRAWEYAFRSSKLWVAGATLAYRKSFWERSRFREIQVGEDCQFVWGEPVKRIADLADAGLCIATIHSGNTSPKRPAGSFWRPVDVSILEKMIAAAAAPVPAVSHASPSDGTKAESPRNVRVPVRAVQANVCVGIHVRTEPKRLLETLSMLAANTDSQPEILLLGDGPDPSTSAVLATLTQHRQSNTTEPRGAPACFNRLLRGSTAPVVIFLESGTLVGPGWLPTLLNALSADPRNGLAGPSTNHAWNEQAAYRDRPAGTANLTALADDARRRFGAELQSLEPLHGIGDFCLAVRREVVAEIGAVDEGFGVGPCWEMEYAARAARAGFRSVWAKGAYVFRHPFSSQRQRDESLLLGSNKRRYQELLCELKLTGAREGYAEHCRGDACPHFAPRELIRRKLELETEQMIPTRTNPIAPAARNARALPMVSCIMPTHDRVDWLRQSISYFQRQDYPERELLVIDDGARDLSDLLPCDPRITYMRLGQRRSIGFKRNHGCSLARGEFVCHWDDDDWYSNERLSAQIAPLVRGGADITGLCDTVFFDLDRWEFWKCKPKLYERIFVHGVHGGTLAYRRSLFGRSIRYPDGSLAEDAAFLRAAVAAGARLARIPGDGVFAYVRHGTNSWKFACGNMGGRQEWERCAEPAKLEADKGFYSAMSAARRGVGVGDVRLAVGV
jgi:glycosyltransferase involved in cell wall biosynthesis